MFKTIMETYFIINNLDPSSSDGVFYGIVYYKQNLADSSGLGERPLTFDIAEQVLTGRQSAQICPTRQ
jgi:hypothetical protein